MMATLGARVVVLSPHLDDGVFSLGAAIARTTAANGEVKVVTVLANDPASNARPSVWDAACGFGTVGEAASVRREEDDRACTLVGAEPVWLPFADDDHGGERGDADVWAALEPSIEWADVVVTPGFPLYHPDHAWLTGLVAPRLDRSRRLGLYVEQPYASWRLIGRGRRTWTAPGLTLGRSVRNLAAITLRARAGRRLQQPVALGAVPGVVDEPTWIALRAGPRAWGAKQRAVRQYRSQLEAFGPLVPSRMALYELGWGGEGLGWVERRR